MAKLAIFRGFRVLKFEALLCWVQMTYLMPLLNLQLEYMLFDIQHVTVGPKLAPLAKFRVFMVLRICLAIVQITYRRPPLSFSS